MTELKMEYLTIEETEIINLITSSEHQYVEMGDLTKSQIEIVRKLVDRNYLDWDLYTLSNLCYFLSDEYKIVVAGGGTCQEK